MAAAKKTRVKPPVAPPPPDLEVRIIEALARLDRLASPKDVLAALPYKRPVTEVTSLLAELAQARRIFSIKKGKALAFIHRDPVAAVDEAITAALASGALTKKDLTAQVKRAAHGLEGMIPTALVRLRGRGVVREHPKVGKQSQRFGLRPPDPTPFLAKAKKEVEAVAKKLLPHGVDRAAVYATLGGLLGLSAPSTKAAPDTRRDEDIVLRALDDLIAREPGSALFPVRVVRSLVPLDKARFDAAALGLSVEGRVVLHHHDFPASLPDDERHGLVVDGHGTHYVAIAKKRPSVNPLAALPNPFEGTVVADAWAKPSVDVADIHRDAFDKCLAALASARRGNSDSVLVYGPAGSGKTHLLARLQRRLVVDAHDAPDHALSCVFVAAKLQTNPAALWQLVRRRLTADLLREHQGITQLQRLIAHKIAAERGDNPRKWVFTLRVLTGVEVGASVSEYMDPLAAEIDRDLFVVIEHLIHRRYPMDATAWLRGDSLPESVLARLGVGPDELPDREEAARRVVTMLCRLAGKTLPIVFCFDQVEALQAHVGDKDALFRFGRMAADLSEAADNVLLISCVQSVFAGELRDGVREADRDRIFKRQSALEPLSPDEVRSLVRLRLHALLPLGVLRETMANAPYYPFDDAFVASLASRSPRLARGVIGAAAARFDELQHERPAPAVSKEGFLQGAFAARRTASLQKARPEESEDTLLHGLPMVWSLRKGANDAAPAPRVEGIDLVLPHEDGPIGVQVCNDTNMTSLAGRLRSLVNRAPGAIADERLAILRDGRLPISRNARKTQEYLVELEGRGVRVVQPSAEAIAALDALRSLVSDARAGDLSVRGETIAESAVIAWLAASLEAELVDLVDDLVPRRTSQAGEGHDARTQLVRDLSDLMSRRHIAALSDAAEELGRPADDVLGAAQTNPLHFGVLQGPPVVLFARASAESLAESGAEP